MVGRLVAFFVSMLLLGCVSSAEDSEIASEVGKYLNATNVVPLNTSEAYRTHSGKIVYVGPGTNGSPHFTYYEVTDLDDIQKLKGAAKEAVAKVSSAKQITLHFMEKEVFHQLPSGSGSRGREKEIATVVVKKE
jgi:hypothetical protein